MQKEKGYIDLGGAFIAILIIGIIIGAIFAYGVPWLWGVVKPFIHAVTA